MDKFINTMMTIIKEFYGDAANEYNDNIAHIVNERHYDRIVNAIDNSGGEIILKGFRDRSRKYIGPTFVKNPQINSELMTQEIFGPVLPIVPVEDENEAIAFINAREKPLALYVMSSREDVVEKFVKRTSSGAVLINDVVFHVACTDVPFGGVGNSGMGQYHGLKGFETLSHMKPVMAHGTLFDVSAKYPPYTEEKSKFIEKFA
jgi:aldehyde dehydrogenase (NAD+)